MEVKRGRLCLSQGQATQARSQSDRRVRNEAKQHKKPTAGVRNLRKAGEYPMSRNFRYGVKFVGYIAEILALENGKEIEHATLDFVSGSVSLMAADALVLVPRRADLMSFVASLPGHADRLTELLCRSTSHVAAEFSGNLIIISAGATLNQVIRQLAKRCSETEQVIEQAERIGMQIQRRPYSEYIDHLKKTGITRVISYGVGIFENGTLSYRPDEREFYVTRMDENRFAVGGTPPRHH
jgi:hypothetical protein